jgi:hypothetical protein
MKLNVKTIRTIMLVISVAVFAVGCASVGKMPVEVDSQVKSMQPPADKALVYVVRPTFLGKPFGGNITANDIYVGTTQGGIYVYAILTPGEYKFKVSGHDNSSDITATIEAGKTYFIEENVYPGFIKGIAKLTLLDNDQGRKALQECSLGDKLGENIAH